MLRSVSILLVLFFFRPLSIVTTGTTITANPSQQESDHTAQNEARRHYFLNDTLSPWATGLPHSNSIEEMEFSVWKNGRMHDGTPFLFRPSGTAADSLTTNQDAIFCLNPKSGSTTLKFILRAAIERRTVSSVIEEVPHGIRTSTFKNFVEAYNDPRIPRIMVVRNPYLRFLSGYKDIIESKQDLQALPPGFTINDSSSFDKFVEKEIKYQREMSGLPDFNDHFRLITKGCGLPQGMTYDYYLPLEHFEYWYEPLIRRLNLQHIVSSPDWSRQTGVHVGHPEQPCYFLPRSAAACGVTCTTLFPPHDKSPSSSTIKSNRIPSKMRGKEKDAGGGGWLRLQGLPFMRSSSSSHKTRTKTNSTSTSTSNSARSRRDRKWRETMLSCRRNFIWNEVSLQIEQLHRLQERGGMDSSSNSSSYRSSSSSSGSSSYRSSSSGSSTTTASDGGWSTTPTTTTGGGSSSAIGTSSKLSSTKHATYSEIYLQEYYTEDIVRKLNAWVVDEANTFGYPLWNIQIMTAANYMQLLKVSLITPYAGNISAFIPKC